jgi:protein-S-isoprenylcysteine O-methyltransferase Ste14
LRRVARLLLVTAVGGALLFALAGTIRDAWLWAYLAVFAAVATVAMLSISDDLARERFRPPAPSADHLSLKAIRIVAIAHLVVAVLDGSRFHWTHVPAWLRIIGLAGFGLSFVLVVRAMAANRFFSAVVRIQDDRGHRVVDRGPYAVVRHPGYAGMIPAVPFSALALGSWIAFPIAVVYSALIWRRVQFEDRFLHENLEGYGAYARRVRYRLVPSLW